MSEENVEFVRKLWQVFDKNGPEAALELTDPDVTWTFWRAGEQVSSTSELLAFLEEFEGERQSVDATVYSVEDHGNFVIAAGSLRLSGSQGLSEFQIHIIYEFDDGRLLRVQSYPSRVDALEALRVRQTD